VAVATGKVISPIAWHPTDTINLHSMETVSSCSAAYITERARNLSLTGRSPRSMTYRLASFSAYVGEERAPSSIGRPEVEEWLASGQWAKRTVWGRISAVRGLYEWLTVRGVVEHDPTFGIKGPKLDRALPRALDPDLVLRAFDACRDVRAELVLSLMVQSGLRCAEVARLDRADVSRKRGEIEVTGKGGHQRVVPLWEETDRLLVRYLAAEPGPSGPLIRSKKDPARGLHPSYLSALVSAVMADAGIKRFPRDGVSGHALRHTAASDIFEQSGDLAVVQEFLGHTSLVSTQIYLRRANVSRIRAAGVGRTYRGPDPTGPAAA
jgi:site-specific recombinase XerC